MKTKTIILFLCFFLFLTGCGRKLESYNSLNEDEVINYVKETIYKELGDEVEIKIVQKEQKILCDSYFDGSLYWKT